MKALIDVESVFSIFHDGSIVGWSGGVDAIELEIDCEYLAERIDKSFNRFYVQLMGVGKFELDPWWGKGVEAKGNINEINEIVQLELEIGSAEIQEDFVIIYCNCHWNDSFSGGNLFLSCREIKVFNQNKNEITIDALVEIGKGYWDSFGKK